MPLSLVDSFRKELWYSWKRGQQIPSSVSRIPCNQQELRKRISPDEDPFDGGVTANWLQHLETTRTPTWIAVRDSLSGHEIHCVSNRSARILEKELLFGLRIMNWLSFSKHTQSDSIIWFWWDHDWDRILPPNTVPSRFHINAGWATPGIREVHVYRREEAFKVLIHESIHALGLDVPNSVTVPVRQQFEQELDYKLWAHFGEAFTELLAEWLWSIVSAHSLLNAVQRWNNQIHCAEVLAKIVWQRIQQSKEEDTNVFAYYIMKWVLLQNSHHLCISLLTKDRGIKLWWDWWNTVKHLLEINVPDTSTTSVSLAMTCSL